jgi:hypothetical protein
MMHPNTVYVVVCVCFFGLLGGLLYAQHNERMACIQAGIKEADCGVLK